LACRVRIKLKRDEACIETSALINSGFETEAPDIVVPVEVARRLELWPPRHAEFAMLDTGGGEIATPYYEAALELELLLSDRQPKKVVVNVVVNPHVHEVLISDYVASMLGISILDLKRGLWRLQDEPDKVRSSEEREEW